MSLVLASIATPLVFSVRSIVSMDFATSVIPVDTTIFPPYFVSGAFSDAMVQTLLLIMRKAMNLKEHPHQAAEYMNIVIIVTGSIVGVRPDRAVHLVVQQCGVRNMRSSTVSAAPRRELLGDDDLQQ